MTARRAARGLLPRLAVVVLLAFVAGLVSATAGHAVELCFGNVRVTQGEDHRCPDPSEDDHPCGPSCACSCCHTPAALPEAPVPAACTAVLSDAAELTLQPSDGLHPMDVPFRIFHPPRA